MLEVIGHLQVARVRVQVGAGSANSLMGPKSLGLALLAAYLLLTSSAAHQRHPGIVKSKNKSPGLKTLYKVIQQHFMVVSPPLPPPPPQTRVLLFSLSLSLSRSLSPLSRLRSGVGSSPWPAVLLGS